MREGNENEAIGKRKKRKVAKRRKGRVKSVIGEERKAHLKVIVKMTNLIIPLIHLLLIVGAVVDIVEENISQEFEIKGKNPEEGMTMKEIAIAMIMTAYLTQILILKSKSKMENKLPSLCDKMMLPS